jgi:recombination protein RecT
MAGNQLVEQRKTIATQLFSEQAIEQLKMALPDIGVNPQRIARIAFTSITLNPDLLRCTPASILRSVILSAQYGLLPDGRQAHLIPYGDQCTFQPDYKGLIALIRRSPKVASYVLDAVFEEDEFEIISGTERFIKHKPNLKGKRDINHLLCVYSQIKYDNGEIDFDYMTKQECLTVRDNHAQKSSKTGKFSPAWEKDTIEMCKKSVSKRHAKKADLSNEVHSAIKADDLAEIGGNQASMVLENSALFGKDELSNILDVSAEDVTEVIHQDPEEIAKQFKDAVQRSGKKYGRMEMVMEFVAICAKAQKEESEQTNEAVMAAAVEDIGGFMNAYHLWAKQKMESQKQTQADQAQADAKKAAQTAHNKKSQPGQKPVPAAEPQQKAKQEPPAAPVQEPEFEPLTDAHRAHLEELMNEYGLAGVVNDGDLVAYFELESLDAMPDEKYSAAVKYLHELANEAGYDSDNPSGVIEGDGGETKF